MGTATNRVLLILEWVVSVIALCVLSAAIWNTLLRIDSIQSSREKVVDETIEAIREKIGNDELWRQVQENLRRIRPKR